MFRSWFLYAFTGLVLAACGGVMPGPGKVKPPPEAPLGLIADALGEIAFEASLSFSK